MTTMLLPEGRQRYFNNDGTPAAGGLVYTYAAGTLVPKTTWSDEAGTVPNANPIVLDAHGEAIIFWSGAYKVNVLQADLQQITGYPVDQIKTDPAGVWAFFVTLALSTGSTLMGWIQAGVGAILRTVSAKLRELLPTPEDFGALGDGGTNDTAAFAKLRTAVGSGTYWLQSNKTYVLDAAPDPFLDNFRSGRNVHLIVGGTNYDVSNAIAGAWRAVVASATKLDIRHAKTGTTVLYLQDGGAGTAVGLPSRGLAVTCDSHWAQVQPATNGGSCDLLWQRSTLNADPGGNRFNETFNETLDRIDFSFATTASGAPSFDSYISIKAGVAPELKFPAVKAQLQSGWETLPRSGGLFGIRLEANGFSAQRFVDPVSSTVLCDVTLAAGFTFKSLGWANATYGSGTLDYMTNGVVVSTVGAANLAFYQNGAEAWRVDTARAFRPGIDNAYSIGTASFRASVIYAATGAINTSDENAKQDIEAIPQAWLDAWGEVEYVRFKYRDSVAEKGDGGARWHVGVIAQRVRDAFKKHGIDPFTIGILCWNEWPDQYTDDLVEETVMVEREIEHVDLVPDVRIVKNDEGEEIEIHYMREDVSIVKTLVPEVHKKPVPRLVKAAGSQYGIRYDEAFALEMAYLRSRLGAAK